MNRLLYSTDVNHVFLIICLVIYIANSSEIVVEVSSTPVEVTWTACEWFEKKNSSPKNTYTVCSDDQSHLKMTDKKKWKQQIRKTNCFDIKASIQSCTENKIYTAADTDTIEYKKKIRTNTIQMTHIYGVNRRPGRWIKRRVYRI